MKNEKFSFSSLEPGSMKNIGVSCGVSLYFTNSSTGAHGFAISFNNAEKPSVPSCNGIKVYNAVSGKTKWLCFELIAPYLEDVFITLCYDLAEYVKGDMSEFSCLRKIRDRFGLWRNLLKVSKHEIDASIEQGYFGEMLFLQKAIAHFGEKDAVESWAGPDKFAKDFALHNTWYEVKTVADSAEKITISSLNQLDDRNPGHLVIVFLEKKPVDSGDPTITGIINSILSSIEDPEIRDQFIRKLESAGISLATQPRFSFLERGIQLYRVDEKFPRLTIADKKFDEIVDIKYSLFIGGLTRFKEDEEDAFNTK